MATTRRCTICEKRKPATSFHKSHRSMCKPCVAEYNRAYREKVGLEYFRLKKREKHAASPLPQLRQGLQNALKRRPTKKGMTIDEAVALYEKQKGCCALSGIKMTWKNETRKPMPTAISYDRIDPSKGYEAKNVRLVCYAVNSFRMQMSDGEMLQFAKHIVRHMRTATC